MNMIVAAHIGIGIRGVEGQQAARASDYAIGEFKFLRNLLFVHGRECYRRNSNLVLYNFYKNMLITAPQFWYGFYNMFSGTSYYDNYMYQCFNLFFAAVPIIVYAVFDQQFPSNILLDTPRLYELGVKDRIFNTSSFWFWLAVAAVQSMVLNFYCYVPLGDQGPTGKMEDFWFAGSLVFTMVVIVSNIKILLFAAQKSILLMVMLIGSVLFYFLFYLIENYVVTLDIYSTLGR